jgi:hypothetical protein
MTKPVTVNEVLDGYVALDLECLDRIYLNAYVPNLQVGGQVVGFLTAHLGNPIPSPAIFEKMGTAFRKAVARFAEHDHIPVVRFTRADRKIEVMRPYLEAQAKTGRSGVAAIGVAQEYANVFTGAPREAPNGIPWFSFAKADRRVTCYYFYLWDDDFGPGFIKICAYFPYPAKIWINGHEWAKRQASHAGIAFTELSNGFAATDDPAVLQGICDRLGPEEIGVFTDRWFSVLPLPLTEADHAGGYWWELSMRQVEVSRTIVFSQPRHARGFLPGPGRRQPRHRPPRPGRADLRRSPGAARPAPGHPGGLQDQGRHPRCRGDRQRLLPALPDQGSTSKTAARCGSRPSSTTPTTWAANAACTISPTCRPGPARSTTACSILNGSVRAASSRVQPLSGSRTRPPRWTGGGPQPCGSATLGSRPWPAPCASPCTPSPASPTRACAP